MTDPSHSDLQRDLGRLEGEMQAAHREIGDMKKVVDEVRGEIRAIRETLSEARGGWKTLLAVAGVAGAAGAGLSKLLPFLIKGP